MAEQENWPASRRKPIRFVRVLAHLIACLERAPSRSTGRIAKGRPRYDSPELHCAACEPAKSD